MYSGLLQTPTKSSPASADGVSYSCFISSCVDCILASCINDISSAASAANIYYNIRCPHPSDIIDDGGESRLGPLTDLPSTWTAVLNKDDE